MPLANDASRRSTRRPALTEAVTASATSVAEALLEIARRTDATGLRQIAGALEQGAREWSDDKSIRCVSDSLRQRPVKSAPAIAACGCRAASPGAPKTPGFSTITPRA